MEKDIMLNRRNFLKLSAAAAGYVLLPGKGFVPVLAQAVLNAATVPKFVNPLPNPLDPRFIFAANPGMDGEGNPFDYEIGMRQVSQNLLGAGFPSTTVWGYSGVAQQAGLPETTYPGRTFVIQRDQPVRVHWTNNLPQRRHLLPVDMTLHWADPATGTPPGVYPTSGVPVVTHVHGGHSESDSDGLPEYWFTPGFAIKGPRWAKETYVYDNDQEAGTLWYHDHALGITRLNVYAGLAGFYLLRDNVDTGLPNNPLGLPANHPDLGETGVFYEIPIVIQDRLFDGNGNLFYPTTGPDLPSTAPNPSALPEFFGEFIIVNGVAWPVLDVEPRQYRFRLLNGSDSRFYNLWINSGSADMLNSDGNGPQIIQIGTDDALLYQPVPLDQLTLGPGERADVVIDFAGWQGETLIMRNNARIPFPKGVTPNPLLDGQIMAFRVGTTVTVPDNPLPATLRSQPIVSPAPVTRTRRLLLFEGIDSYGRLQPMLGVAEPATDVRGNAVEGTLLWDDHLYPITENPDLGDVEVWEVFNSTADAHPIHLHLVTFQILSRQKFRATVIPKELIAHDGTTSMGGTLTGIRLQGQPKPAEPNERGWKDTAQMFPGEVTRIIARFDRPGRYVWHCHILSHEDHEMMRPYQVGPLLDPLVLCGPEEGTIVSGQATLCWQAVPYAPCYELQIAENAGFTTNPVAYTVVAPLTEYTTALPAKTYFWRVRVGGACTDVFAGEWSEIRSFTLS
jgi:spore coat protein A, manganese oxidase